MYLCRQKRMKPKGKKLPKSFRGDTNYPTEKIPQHWNVLCSC